ncbi:hypothetical protein MMC13_000801 [Lambiella insularis]|nr:hypothetical protein [Lambiella insularis]
MDTTGPAPPKSMRYGEKEMTSNVHATIPPQMPRNPFGHWFQEEPAPPAPAPARGEALFNDNETNKFHDFFNQMEVGHFDDSALMFDDAGQSGDGDSWLFHDELPPLFQGSSTSLTSAGAQSTPSRNHGQVNILLGNFNSPQASQFPHPTPTSPTILAAASTLMRNGRNDFNNGHYRDVLHSPFDVNSPNMFDGSNFRFPATFSEHSFAGHLRKPISTTPVNSYLHRQANVRHGGSSGDRITFNGGLHLARNNQFDSSKTIGEGPVHADGGSHLQWGSDNNFSSNQFFPPPHLETEAHVTDGLLERVQNLAERTSAASTQPSSPVMQRPKKEPNITNGGGYVQDLAHDGSDNVDDARATPNTIAKKRRKARPEIKDEDLAANEEEDDWQGSIPRRGKRQKRSMIKNGKKNNHILSQAKHRDSEPTDQKTGKDNLTEEQRRENHILSEQKRRNLIKQGFDDLSELVPGLKSGGFSKSAMLTQAVEWLEALLDGNTRLQMQLGELEGGVRQ